jgi:hypothetical protein
MNSVLIKEKLDIDPPSQEYLRVCGVFPDPRNTIPLLEKQGEPILVAE